MINFRNRFVGTKAGAALAITGGAGLAPAAASAATAPQIDLNVLLLGTSGDPNFAAWEAALQREGVQYTPITANGSANQITPSTLSGTNSSGTPVANYDAVIVSTGDLAIDCNPGPCTSGLTSAEWSDLETYEEDFGVREITSDIYPSSGYGMNSPTFSGVLDGTQGALTTDGQTDFPYLKPTAPITMDTGTYGYEATPNPTKGTSFDTLVTGPSSSSLVGIYTDANGVQNLVETFDQNDIQLQSLLLRHGLLNWVTRGVYFGDQRNYVEMDIDDTFTPDDAWDTATHSIDYSDADALRMQPADVNYAAQWSDTNDFRMDQLFNGGGSVNWAADCADGSQTTGCNGTTDTDPLLAAFQADCTSDCGPGNASAGKPYADSFGWISHTYDTPYLDVGCATQDYIEAELNENTSWADTAIGTGANAGSGGLGLTDSTDPTLSLGYENGQVFVPGNHSGFADLVPGNPATVDPPDLDSAGASADSSSTLPAGTYEYAVSDQFVNGSSDGLSAADVTSPITVAKGDSVTLTWESICHAADYVIYRGYKAPSATSYTWVLLQPAAAQDSAFGTISTPFSATLPDNSSGDATPPSTTNVTGAGETEQTYTDTGSAATTAEASGFTPPSTENAVESPWEQNPYFIPALEAVGITAVGDDGSKPYPDPSTDEFGIGVPVTVTGTGSSTTCSPVACYPADYPFVEGTAQVVPRHPINIFYNASTDEMELDEYQTLYNNTSVCNDTTCTWYDVIDQVVPEMFQYVMANDPRPSYVHQTNLMGQPPAGSMGTNGFPSTTYTPPTTTCTAGEPCTAGDGTLYQVLDPLLYEYNEYFNSSAPFEQPTEQAQANLLAEQTAWSAQATATKGGPTVSGYIQGNQVTVTNAGTAAVETPLTGVTTVGSSYGGITSGWTSAAAGSTTYTSSTTWPTVTG